MNYLDMFSDQFQLNNYVSATNFGIDSIQARKYSEVFKNHQIEIDETNIYRGNIYNHFQDKLKLVFNDSNTTDLVCSPSIDVTRVESNGADQFSYGVYIDLTIKARKNPNWSSTLGEKYIPSEIVLRDIPCKVSILPRYPGFGQQLKYDVVYDASIVESDELVGEFSKIIYIKDGNVKTKSIPTKTFSVTGVN